MDINLTGMTGIQCVSRLKPSMPGTQYLMLTVYEDSQHIFEALAAGASGYLLKRTPREELLASIKQVHEGGAPMTSYIARKVVQAFHRPKSNKPEVGELSPREWEVLGLLARGFAYKEIADALGISLPTVNTHIHRTYEKLHVRSRGEAVACFLAVSAGAVRPARPPCPLIAFTGVRCQWFLRHDRWTVRVIVITSAHDPFRQLVFLLPQDNPDYG